jgi:hypothetical protein
MTTSDEISLHDAFENVKMPIGAAQSLLQWMGQQVGHDTEAGRALNLGGATLAAEPDPPVTRSTSTSGTSSTSKS